MAKESYTLLDNQIWEDENLSHTEFRVLSYLIRTYRVEYGYSFPKRETIAKKCKIHKDTLNKVLNSLEENGYITRAINPRKGGRNNIYYIHKYLVASKKDTTEAPAEAKPSENERKPSENERKPCETDAKATAVEVEVGREQSTNELLVKQKAKLVRQLKAEELEEINQLDTELLIKAIERANSYKPNGYHIGYLLKTYDSVKNNPTEPQREAQSNNPINNSNDSKKSSTGATGEYHNNNYPVKTKYHGSFNEHFRKYTDDELEAKLLKAQAEKRKGLAQ